MLFLTGAAGSEAVPPIDSCGGFVGRRACLNAVGCAWSVCRGSSLLLDKFWGNSPANPKILAEQVVPALCFGCFD